jgi:hypothetical protein
MWWRMWAGGGLWSVSWSVVWSIVVAVSPYKGATLSSHARCGSYLSNVHFLGRYSPNLVMGELTVKPDTHERSFHTLGNL